MKQKQHKQQEEHHNKPKHPPRQAQLPRAAIYVRTSTKEQEKKISPTMQAKQCKTMATLKGLQVYKVYQDARERTLNSFRQGRMLGKH